MVKPPSVRGGSCSKGKALPSLALVSSVFSLMQYLGVIFTLETHFILFVMNMCFGWAPGIIVRVDNKFFVT
jgi:hypothetical protein